MPRTQMRVPMKKGGTVEMDVEYEVDAGFVEEACFYFTGSKKEVSHLVEVDKAIEKIQEDFEGEPFEGMTSGQIRGWVNRHCKRPF